MRFALLTDFPDASSEKMPEDEALVQNAAAAIDSLNNKYENSHSNEDMGAGQEGEPTKTKWFRNSQALLLSTSKADLESI